MTPEQLWDFPIYYLTTIAIETPILLLCLSARHSWKVRLFSGIWLTACTYPVVYLVLPMIFDITTERTMYLVVAETFAPVGECALFWAAFGQKEHLNTRSMWQDFGAIVLANLASFVPFELIHHYREQQAQQAVSLLNLF